MGFSLLEFESPLDNLLVPVTVQFLSNVSDEVGQGFIDVVVEVLCLHSDPVSGQDLEEELRSFCVVLTPVGSEEVSSFLYKTFLLNLRKLE